MKISGIWWMAVVALSSAASSGGPLVRERAPQAAHRASMRAGAAGARAATSNAVAAASVVWGSVRIHASEVQLSAAFPASEM